MKNHTRLGFTLIELIIAISVLAILSSVAFLGVNGVLISARDKTHEGNIRAISAALEDYYNKNGEYPKGIELNPTSISTELSDFSGVKSFLPELTDSNLIGPQNYKFFPYCSYTTADGGPCAATTGGEWLTYHSKQYIYLTTYSGVVGWQVTQTAAIVGSNTGWGCSVRRDDSNPGYALAYRRESDGRWMFYKSRRGIVEVFNYSSPNPSPCTFTAL